jgi:hypothetical protein
MAKPNLDLITTSQTFQNWFDKTNEMVTLFKTDAITASSGGDTTSGNATLVGTFTGTNIAASTLLSTNALAARTGSVIGIADPIIVTSASSIAATFSYSGTGGQARFTDGAISWDVGMDSGGNNNFIIDTGAAPAKFLLTPAGTMTVPNAVVTENLTVGSLTIGAGGAGLSTDVISEGTTNLYHTTARVRAAVTGGDGINVNATTGVISFDGEGELNSYQGNKFIATGSIGSSDEAFMSGKQVSGSPFGVLNATTSGSNVESFYWSGAGAGVNGAFATTGNIQTTGGIIYVKSGSTIRASIDQSGNGYFTGDLTTFGTASDERLKENIVPLTSCLEKTLQLNGVMFNYKDRPEDTIPGVIAQEVEKVLPEAVYNIEIEDETYKAVRYPQLVPMLIEAIKELTEKVNTLENRLNNDG